MVLRLLSMIPPESFCPPTLLPAANPAHAGQGPSILPSDPWGCISSWGNPRGQDRGSLWSRYAAPRSKEDGRQTIGRAARPSGTSLLEGIRLTSVRDGWVLPEGRRGN